MNSLWKKPGAWIPPAMSLLAIAGILGYVAVYGIAEPQIQKDEGAPARIFQFFLLMQAAGIAFFTVRWLPQEPKHAPKILAIQIAAALVPVFLILFLEA